MKALAIFYFISVVAAAAHADDFILCSYLSADSPAIKINTKDLEVGKCPIALPSSKLKDYQFRVSRHHKSGLLRIVVKNEKTNLWMRSLGGADQVSISLGLSEAEGRDVANQVGLTGSKVDELTVTCNPSHMDSEAYLLIKGSDDCYKK